MACNSTMFWFGRQLDFLTGENFGNLFKKTSFKVGCSVLAMEKFIFAVLKTEGRGVSM